MRRAAEEAFREKVEEIINDLQAWLKKKHVLDVGETVVIDIRLEVTPTVRMEMPRRGKKIIKYTSEELTEEDWKKIMKLHFSATLRSILEMIRKKNNHPTSAFDIESMLKEKFGSTRGAYKEAINAQFSRNKYPYRINGVDGNCWNNLKIFIIEVP